MPTDKIFLNDAYRKTEPALVVGIGPAGGLLLNRTLFYATSGGQPNDLGSLSINGQCTAVTDVRKLGAEDIEVFIDRDAASISVGSSVIQELDWERRYRFMKLHTALHLLSVVVPLPVTGGAISIEKGRLDFAMPEPLTNREELEGQLNKIIEGDYRVSHEWIDDSELQANMDLIKTMSVKPPMGTGKVRLIRIYRNGKSIDLQPCGGTHVASTREIGSVRLGKVEKKGRNNRRVNLFVV